jgi:drug/metabolite transporter (DMT)-like permease
VARPAPAADGAPPARRVDQGRAYALALAAVFLWSTVASAFKLSLRAVSPVTLLLGASLVSALAVCLILAAQGRLRLLTEDGWRGLGRSALLGFLNPFLYYVILFEAYQRLPGQEAQPLNFTWAITLTVLSVPLLGQRIRPAGFAAILVSFIGVYVISTRGDLTGFRFTDPVGVACALGSSVLWALFWILSTRDRRDAVAKLGLSFAWGTVYTVILAAVLGELSMPPRAGLVGAVYVGLFEMGVTFVLWQKALELSRTTAQISNLIFLAPFVSLVLLHLVAGESIYPSSVVGLVFIVAGILMQRRWG